MADRGSTIEKARKLRKLSRRQLAELTGVAERTIQRIETGETNESSKFEILEHELAAELRVVSRDAPSAGPSLADAEDVELLGELARRLAQRRGSAKPDNPYRAESTLGGDLVEFLTADAPSAQRAKKSPRPAANEG